MSDALILTVAPNGAYKQPADHPALPITPEALAQTAKACLDAGAAVLHLHVRKPDGAHSLAPEDYRAAIATVRAAVGQDLVVQITTEAAGVYQPPAQIAAVHAVQPEAVSVGLRELTRPVLDKRLVGDFFTHLQRRRVMTQVILYDTEDLQEWLALRAEGVVPDGAWSVLFVLGRYRAGQTSSPSDLLPFLHAWTGDEAARTPWAMCAFGPQEYRCAMAAAALGGHVRVGFENNLFLRDGRTAPDNAALVHQAAEGVRALGLSLATAEQVRAGWWG